MTASSAWRLGGSYLCLGVGWRSGVPCLDVVEASANAPSHVPLVGQFLGFRVPSPLRYCTGRYAFSEQTDTVHVPCPTHGAADKGGQCAQCASQDDFRFAHHFHTGGHAPDSLVRYMQQPHWVYIATFADGTSKVGTAANQRQKSRLDEQGALVATYVARTADGRIARNVEDAITRDCAVAQTKSRSAKLAALAAPLPAQQLQERHNELLRSVVSLVERLARTSSGLSGLRTAWEPPDETRAIVTAPPGGWPVYEHDVLSGEHGLYVEGCCGQTALVRTEESEAPLRYLVDLGKLKGMRLVAGEFSSPGSAVQSALF
ncbi:DUF2797 domain-containing protein [Streptomyces sp. NPDC091972]|uniref:DUF2797 domain-containing protein n=1 Tax=Streptomyces sp. NPDC091972 TaxID=3366007 RepID=UPI0037F3B99C